MTISNTWNETAINAWTAGVIDGEGTIQIVGHTRTKKEKFTHGSFQLRILVSNTRVEMIKMLIEFWGGNICVPKRNKESSVWATSYRWTVLAKRACNLLERCLPYFVIKRKQAELAIEFQNRINQRKGYVVLSRRTGIGKSVNLLDEEVVTRQKLQLEIRKLNQKGKIGEKGWSEYTKRKNGNNNGN